ncbi:MAG: transketolase [Deltaproteobacteria bacterium]|nr:transketolase [Deltaproteobacteria bacterium]
MDKRSDSIALAKQIRIDSLEMTSSGGGSHLGSCLSCADILAVLYGSIMNKNPEDPLYAERDRFILSKGHAGAAVYSALARSGYFSPDELKTHYQNGSKLSGHVSHKDVPGVELSTGSLGHGLSVACGMAYSAKLEGKSHRVFVLLSDGECDEGTTWEAALFASHRALSRLVAIVDYNKIQSLDTVESVLALEPFAAKWESFGWDVVEVDGHDHEELSAALAEDHSGLHRKPRCIIAHTVKGKGVSFMENTVLWHYRTARGEELENARDELGADSEWAETSGE